METDTIKMPSVITNFGLGKDTQSKKLVKNNCRRLLIEFSPVFFVRPTWA